MPTFFGQKNRKNLGLMRVKSRKSQFLRGELPL